MWEKCTHIKTHEFECVSLFRQCISIANWIITTKIPKEKNENLKRHYFKTVERATSLNSSFKVRKNLISETGKCIFQLSTKCICSGWIDSFCWKCRAFHTHTPTHPHVPTTVNNKSNDGSAAICDKTYSIWNNNHTNGVRRNYLRIKFEFNCSKIP